MIWYLLALLVALIGAGVYVYLRVQSERKSHFDGNLQNFRRGLDALNPDNDPLRPPRNKKSR